MMRSRRQMLDPDVGSVGISEERTMGVTSSVVDGWAGLRVGGGAEEGARAARTRERGLGKRTAMSGARGRERQ